MVLLLLLLANQWHSQKIFRGSRSRWWPEKRIMCNIKELIVGLEEH